MSTETAQPLSLLHVDFEGLYTRHLGRHSQFGINVNHLCALFLLWFGIYAFLTQAARHFGVPSPWSVPVGLAVAYLVLISLHSPLRVVFATAAFLALFLGCVLLLPTLPGWVAPLFLLLVPIGYKIQARGHKIWTIAADMSDFNRRFPPGRNLNLILLFYEVPICLNYLAFQPKDWRR
jgi:hypothetical protein